MDPLPLKGIEYLIDTIASHIHIIIKSGHTVRVIKFIGSSVMCTFLNVNPPAMLHLLTYPPGYVLGSRVKRKQLVEIAMVKIAMDTLLDFAEIHHHTLGIEPSSAAVDCYNPVMSVQTAAFAFIWQRKAVRAGYFYMLGDVIHRVG